MRIDIQCPHCGVPLEVPLDEPGADGTEPDYNSERLLTEAPQLIVETDEQNVLMASLLSVRCPHCEIVLNLPAQGFDSAPPSDFTTVLKQQAPFLAPAVAARERQRWMETVRAARASQERRDAPSGCFVCLLILFVLILGIPLLIGLLIY